MSPVVFKTHLAIQRSSLDRTWYSFVLNRVKLFFVTDCKCSSLSQQVYTLVTLTHPDTSSGG